MDRVKKLNSLLDEKLILNFKFIMRLFVRYKYVSMGAPLLTFMLAMSFFKFQNQIHAGSIYFWYVKEKDSSQANPLSALVSDDSDSLKPAEVLGILESSNFQHVLAKAIYDTGEAPKLNYNSINSQDLFSWEQFTENCPDEKCVINFIGRKVPALFSTQMDDTIPNRYLITVKSLDRFTTDFMINILSKTIERYRADTAKHQLRTQIKVTESLMDKQKQKIDHLQISRLQTEKNILEASLEGHLKKIDLFNQVMEEKMFDLEQARISLKHTNSTLQDTISIEEKERLTEYQNLTLRKKLLMADITALEYSLGERSSHDKNVIKTLNLEIEKINQQLSKLTQTRTIASLEQFQTERQNSKELIQFNEKILADQIADLNQRTNMLEKTKTDLIQQIRNKNDLIEENRTIIEYYKLLQSKLLTLQITESTIVSDLVFEDYLENTRRYKRYTLFLIVPFAIVLSLVITFLIILIRYTLDNHLLNEEEFKNIFDELPVIGTVPNITQNNPYAQ